MIKQLSRTFWRICLLQAGPQDVPYSLNLLVITLLVNYLLGCTILAKSLGVVPALMQISLLMFLSLLYVGLVLFAVKKLPRFLQTATALMVCNIIISCVSLLLVYIANLAIRLNVGGVAHFMQSVSMLSMGWFLLITGHIFKEALGSKLIIGLILAILMMVLVSLGFHWLLGE